MTNINNFDEKRKIIMYYYSRASKTKKTVKEAGD